MNQSEGYCAAGRGKTEERASNSSERTVIWLAVSAHVPAMASDRWYDAIQSQHDSCVVALKPSPASNIGPVLRMTLNEICYSARRIAYA